MLVKIMSDDERTDDDPQKAFQLLDDVLRIQFQFIEGEPFVGLELSSGKKVHARMHGNVYVLNEIGDVIAVHSHESIDSALVINDTGHDDGANGSGVIRDEDFLALQGQVVDLSRSVSELSKGVSDLASAVSSEIAELKANLHGMDDILTDTIKHFTKQYADQEQALCRLSQTISNEVQHKVEGYEDAMANAEQRINDALMRIEAGEKVAADLTTACNNMQANFESYGLTVNGFNTAIAELTKMETDTRAWVMRLQQKIEAVEKPF